MHTFSSSVESVRNTAGEALIHLGTIIRSDNATPESVENRAAEVDRLRDSGHYTLAPLHIDADLGDMIDQVAGPRDPAYRT